MIGPSDPRVLTKKLVSRFVQRSFGTAGVQRNVTDQFAGELINVGTFEVIKLPAVEVENRRADRHGDAMPLAVEYGSIHAPVNEAGYDRPASF
jgi:hypothetical protein